MGIRIKKPVEEIVIDLDGPQGNAFVIMATATDIGRQLGYNALDCATINKEMMQGDYPHLLRTFLKHFGDYVTIETTDELLIEEVERDAV